MANRISAVSWLWIATGAALLMSAQVSSQSKPPRSACPDDTPAVFHACALGAAKTFTPPRTGDGKPNLSGMWRRRATSHEDLEAHPKTLDDTGGPSVVIDPSDGKVPMQPWADAQRRQHATKFVHNNAACFLSGVPSMMYVTSLYQFMQTPDHLVIQTEEAHAYRIIPLSRPPRVAPAVPLWLGFSRGQWDGNTLVIDTTSQNGKAFLDQRGRFYTEEARVTERLTLVDAGTIHYQATLADANVYTRPWTIAIAFRRDTTQTRLELLEEACHEDNLSLGHLLGAGLSLYPGITSAQARARKAAWEARAR